MPIGAVRSKIVDPLTLARPVSKRVLKSAIGKETP